MEAHPFFAEILKIVDDMISKGTPRDQVMRSFGFAVNDEVKAEIERIPHAVFRATLSRNILRQMIMRPSRKRTTKIDSIEQIAGIIQGAKNILVLTGAGVSTSCGIPDFRSKQGVYSIVGADDRLGRPEDLFHIKFFKRNVRPFYEFAKKLWPGKHKPSPCHRFIRELERRGKLLRKYVDTHGLRADFFLGGQNPRRRRTKER